MALGSLTVAKIIDKIECCEHQKNFYLEVHLINFDDPYH